MKQPDVSAALLRVAGDEFIRDLRDRLIELANSTSDMAYASRLRLVANGERPLRALLQDPQWQESFSPLDQNPSEFAWLISEQSSASRAAAEQARECTTLPNEQQVSSDVADVLRRADLAKQAFREEEMGGWKYVHDPHDDKSGSPSVSWR